MALTNRILLVVICASFLLGLGAWLHAQTTDTARIVSGSDIGFRIEGRRGNTPLGTFVIKINGQWVPVESAAAPKALTTGN
jgi:hypothetical protein